MGQLILSTSHLKILNSGFAITLSSSSLLLSISAIGTYGFVDGIVIDISECLLQICLKLEEFTVIIKGILLLSLGKSNSELAEMMMQIVPAFMEAIDTSSVNTF